MKIYSIFKLFIILAVIPNFLYSQNSKDNTTNETLEEEFSSVMFNVSYTSNNMEYLTGVTEKLPTLFATISYFHKTGLYTGIDYSSSSGDSLNSHEYSLQAGYQKYFDNGFDIDLSYSWHNFSGDSLLDGINYNHSIDLSAGIEAGKFYLSGNGSYKLGTTNNFFSELSLSRFIQIDKIFTKHDVLMINPGISISFGTDYWLYENMSLTEKQTTFAELENQGYSYENFSYEGFTIFLPVSYGIKNIYLTGSWLYKIPGNKYEYLGWENQSGIMFSLTYFLNFNK